MSPDAWISIAVVLAVFAALARSQVAPYLVLLAGVTVLMLTGVLTPAAAVAGFSNEGLLTVGALFVVVAGLRQTGALATLTQGVLGHPKSEWRAQARLALPVMLSSAFLNNTPIVAMMIPVIKDWSQRISVPASRMLIPLSYFAILGGTCTLIGTSTNLVVNGLLIERGLPGMGLFDIAPAGLAVATAGLLFMLLVGRHLLPAGKQVDAAKRAADNPREYAVEMEVMPGGAVAEKSIEAAGLRHLPSLYLMEIHRDGEIIPCVDPEQRLKGGDQLVFVGLVDSIIDLQRIAGLQPATKQVFRLKADASRRVMAEAVVSPECAIINRTIRDGRFRERYNAVVIAVSRNGQRINSRIGDIELQAGDSLLLECMPSFVERNRNSRDFFLISQLQDAAPPNRSRAPVALLILAAMVGLAGSGLLSMLEAAFVAAGGMLLGRCCSQQSALRQIDLPLLLAIAAAFGLGRGLSDSGAAGYLAQLMQSMTGGNPMLSLILIYVFTAILTELVTNNAAAVIVFPIAYSTAETLGVNPMPFMVALMIGASAAFATPLGYQTNLMVYGAGNYRFGDFLKVGLPMNLVVGVTALIVCPLVWPF